MQKIVIELSGIVAAAVVFYLTGILLLPVVALAWPINISVASDLPLKPQHIPSMVIGFIVALYTFRRLTIASKKA
jgi:hypothetical protein